MLCDILGNFLVDKKLVNEQQLADVVESMGQTRVKLGLIAVSEKMITQKQADEINNRQAMLDKRFGDIAVELGYLTGQQVSHLLDMQGNAYMQLCQTISDKGYMSLDDIENALLAFCSENGFEESDADIFKSDDIDKIAELYLKDMDDVGKGLALVVIRTINRLISNKIILGKGRKIESYNAEGYGRQQLTGGINISTCFTGNKDGMKELGSIFAKERFDEVDEDCLDSIAEFINVVNGLYATTLSYRKIDTELVAPVYKTGNETFTGTNMWIIPITINDCRLDLIIDEL